MGNILTATVQVRGTRPLLWHHFGPDTITLGKRERTGVAGNDPAEWKRSVLYLPETGQLYIEPTYVFGCLRDGAKYTKKGKASIQRLVTATLQVLDDSILVDRFIPGYNGGLPKELATDPTLPVYLDIRSVRNPGTGAHNVRYRVAASVGWATTFRILWDATIVGRGEMEAVTIDAGRFSGLGSGRAIGFGRFEVLQFDVEEV